MNSLAGAELSARLFEQISRITKALASPNRLQLIELLAQGECTVEQLARAASLSVANTSSHLQTLLAARLVAVRRSGSYAYYRIARVEAFRAWQAIRALGESSLAEVDLLMRGYRNDRGVGPMVPVEELVERMNAGNVVVLDARPEPEYRAGHIAGALSMPVDVLESRLHVLPDDREVIAYCRGPLCVFSDEAVAMLRADGIEARRLAVGFPDWKAAGLPVEAS